MQNNKDDNVKERRRFPRYAVHYIAKVFLNDKMLCGTIINISERGIGILLPKRLSLNSVLGLKIRNILSEDESKGIDLKARIVWMNEKEIIDGMYRAGLEIVGSSEEDLEILVEHIQYLDGQTER